MDTQPELIEAIGRARAGSGQRIRELLQSSPRRAHVLLRASIRRGLLTAGRPVEEQNLIMSMMMSRNSIRSALTMLGAEGLIERRQKVGTSVVASISELPLLELLPVGGWTRAEEDPERPSVALEISELERGTVFADEHIRSRLDIDDERVLMREDLVTRGGEPLGVLVGYYPISAPDLLVGDDDRDAQLNAMRQVALSHVEATVEAVNCDERTAKVLKVAVGAAILVRETVVHGADGRPTMLAYGHYRGDRVALWAKHDDVPAMLHTHDPGR
ncbi:GntR family transcriptional regulator [Curtobacterium pusillum]|uniref:GntR family transcriptional regulator n=1 Tax=Curtobacterium pusillum TaxID=69373 RepID=UPI0011A3A4FE|nr:GntR family transcriptional regulator [Curtobacterium pusillum]